MDKATNEEVCPVVQIQAMKQDLTEKPCDFMWCVDKIKRGDIVGLQGPPRLARRSVARPLKADALCAAGFPGRSKKGELSVFPTSMQVRSCPQAPLLRVGAANHRAASAPDAGAMPAHAAQGLRWRAEGPGDTVPPAL